MRWRRPRRLRTQMALAMVAAICLTVASGYVGLSAAARWHEARLFARLPPEAQRAVRAMEAGEHPALEDFETLLIAEKPLLAAFEDSQRLLLVGLTLTAALIGVGTSLILARRISAPVEAVEKAARALAAGDLSARAAHCAGPVVGEAAQLLEHFNRMAATLETYEREIREGSAAVAHELRTPLTILRGRLQGMRDGVFEREPADFDKLIRQTEALAHIVDDLQIVSLASAGAMSLDRAPMDLAQEIAALMEALRPYLEADGLSVDLQLGSARLSGDAGRLRQAVMALVENARRHACDGGVVQVSTRSDKGQVVLSVADRGPGAPVENASVMFGRFWRGAATGGNGIGLSVVAAIAAAHGGEARARSRPGGGLVVEMCLPCGATSQSIEQDSRSGAPRRWT